MMAQIIDTCGLDSDFSAVTILKKHDLFDEIYLIVVVETSDKVVVKYS